MVKMRFLSQRWLLGLLCLIGFFCVYSALWIGGCCFCRASSASQINGGGLSVHTTVILHTNNDNNIRAEKQKQLHHSYRDAKISRCRGCYVSINVNVPNVNQIAKFAVSEMNKQKKSKLVLEGVIAGQSQLVYGRNYKLVIAVREYNYPLPPTPLVKYEVLVYVSFKDYVKKLKSFHQVD